MHLGSDLSCRWGCLGHRRQDFVLTRLIPWYTAHIRYIVSHKIHSADTCTMDKQCMYMLDPSLQFSRPNVVWFFAISLYHLFTTSPKDGRIHTIANNTEKMHHHMHPPLIRQIFGSQNFPGWKGFCSKLRCNEPSSIWCLMQIWVLWTIGSSSEMLGASKPTHQPQMILVKKTLVGCLI